MAHKLSSILIYLFWLDVDFAMSVKQDAFLT